MPTKRKPQLTKTNKNIDTHEKQKTRHSLLKNSKYNNRRSKQKLTIAFSTKVKIILAIIFILILWFIVDSIAFMNKCYEGVSIEGIEVSGLTNVEAKEKLENEFEKSLNEKTLYIFTDINSYDKINLDDYFSQQDRIAEQLSSIEQANDVYIFQTNAADIGATYNYDFSIDEALNVCHDFNIISRISSRIFGTNIDLNIETGDGLDSLYSRVSKTTGQAHVDFDIKITNGEVSVIQGCDGSAINREKFTNEIINALTIKTNLPQKLLFEIEYDPVLIDENKATDAKLLAESIISNGAIFLYDEKEIRATNIDLGSWITTRICKEDDLTFLDVYFDENKTKQGVLKLLNSISAVFATNVEIVKDAFGNVIVNPPNDVKIPDLQTAVDKLNDNRNSNYKDTLIFDIPQSEKKDNFTFQDALDLGLITMIESYTTTFTNTTSTSNRNHNIALVSDTISNTIVNSNGGEFSFNSASGPCDAEHGYLQAGTQVAGQVVQEAGGGICQVATTVFNAAYNAGYPITERHNHTLRNLSYPAGLDAAVYVSEMDNTYSEDLCWKNDTTSDVLLKSWHDDTSVTVALYGISPSRRVESYAGDYEEGEKHTIIFSEDESVGNGQWTIKTVGTDGSKITVERKVFDENDNLLYDNYFVSEYAKVDEEILIGKDVDKEKIKEAREKNN